MIRSLRSDVFALEPTRQDLRHVCVNMRPLDWREIECLYTDLTREKLAESVWLSLKSYLFARVFCVTPKSPPIAFLGVAGAGALGAAAMWATPEFRRIARGMTEFVGNELAPHLARSGVRRVEARAWDGNGPALRWLRRLGAVEECALPEYGQGGETFVQFAWRASDVLRRTETAAAA